MHLSSVENRISFMTDNEMYQLLTFSLFCYCIVMSKQNQTHLKFTDQQYSALQLACILQKKAA